MKKFRVQSAAVILVSLSAPGLLGAASCPPDVKEVRDLLTAKTAAASAVRPKSQASARGQETQAPRGQETQAPRGQDTQAPRNVAKGRSTALINARRLVNEAEAACMDNDTGRAASNARAARELLGYLP